MFVLVLAACAPPAPSDPEILARTSASAFTRLLKELRDEAARAAVDLADLGEHGAGRSAFRTLDGIVQQLGQTGPGTPALSVWGAGGEPVCWAGSPGPPPAASPGVLPFFEVRALGTELHLRAWVPGPGQNLTVAERSFPPGSTWNPMGWGAGENRRLHVDYTASGILPTGPPPEGTGPVSFLDAPDGTHLGTVAVILTSTHPAGSLPIRRVGPWASLVVLLVAFLLGTRRRGWLMSHAAGASGFLAASLGIWAVRLLLRSALGMVDFTFFPGLADPSLFATDLPLGLTSSPLDALLTGLALLAQGALAVRAMRSPGRRGGWSPLWLAPSMIWLLGAVLFVSHAGLDSQVNLLAVRVDPLAPPRTMTQIGLFFFLWAPLLPAATRLLRSPAQRLLVQALLEAPLAAFLLFASLTATSGRMRRELVENNLRPQVLSQEADRLHSLSDSRRHLVSTSGLADLLRKTLARGRADALAYRLWNQTDLAFRQYHSSLEIYDSSGRLRGAFGVEMPPPVPEMEDPRANLQPAEGDRVIFSTLSQAREAFLDRWPVYDGPALVGSLALYVSNDLDNLPTLTRADPAWFPVTISPSPDVIVEILGEDPILTVYDRGHRLIWSNHPETPSPPRDLWERVQPSMGLWQDVESTSHRAHILYFSDGTSVFGLGFHHQGWVDRLSQLLRLEMVLVLSALLVLGATFVSLAGIRASLEALRHSLRNLGASYSRKLISAALLASLLPLLGLAIVLRTSLHHQRTEILFNRGLQAVDVARRVVRDAMVTSSDSSDDGPETSLTDLTDNTLFWLSRVIRQEVDLFSGGLLVATSREGLYSSGLLPSVPPADVYRRITLGGEQAILSFQRSRGGNTAIISAPLGAGTGPPAILSLPLHLQEAEVQRRINGIQQLADVATATVALFLVGASILLGRGMSSRLSRLTHATERVASGEEEVQVASRSPDEIGRLTDAFNTMARALARQRTALRRRTETLEKILLHAPTGIVSLDGRNRVAMANPAAQRLLRLSHAPVPGVPLDQAVNSSPFAADLLQLAARDRHPSSPLEAELRPADGKETRLRAVLAQLPPPAEGALLILEDMTEAIRSNRLAAWADMARRIAHEIKNPLTPIRLCTEHLQKVYQAQDPCLGETLTRTVATILHQVEVLRDIASDFSLYARIPALERKEIDPARLLMEVVEPYRQAPPSGVRMVFHLPADLPRLFLDEKLIRRALINLVENALQAMPEGGTLTFSSRILAGGRGVEIRVVDTGKGMDPDTLERIFEPYFSTRDTGTGLGLAIARRAVEEHGGSIQVVSAPARGSTFTITLPAIAAEAAKQ